MRASYLGKLLSSSLGALESVVPGLGWERTHGNATGDSGPLLHLAYLPPFSLSVTYCTVNTRRDQGVSLYLFQGNLLPGRPEVALGAWSLPGSLHKSSISGLGEMGSLGVQFKEKRGCMPIADTM